MTLRRQPKWVSLIWDGSKLGMNLVLSKILDMFWEQETFNQSVKAALGDDGDIDHGSLVGLADQEDHTYAVTRDGTRELTADWDAGPYEICARTLESDVATGTAPLSVGSLTVVPNLNADMVDGHHWSDGPPIGTFRAGFSVGLPISLVAVSAPPTWTQVASEAFIFDGEFFPIADVT